MNSFTEWWALAHTDLYSRLLLVRHFWLFLFFLLQQESLLLKELWEPRHSAHIDLMQDMQKTAKRKIMGRLPCHVKKKQGINVLYAEEPRKTGIIWYSDIVQNVMVTLNIVRITFIHTFIWPNIKVFVDLYLNFVYYK